MWIKYEQFDLHQNGKCLFCSYFSEGNNPPPSCLSPCENCSNVNRELSVTTVTQLWQSWLSEAFYRTSAMKSSLRHKDWPMLNVKTSRTISLVYGLEISLIVTLVGAYPRLTAYCNNQRRKEFRRLTDHRLHLRLGCAEFEISLHWVASCN